ncbi:hypothetical protein AVEN_244793-1 [Araneus ventricosus]|uniref:Mos1 transposase HTH domain-containing protein n=1 Tax=Araneus ventricosus TaxID=182803 RepID=A0A4Y2Q1A4_ARAVE|nr:hypothetical protein AVEN_244793-1 [Araneus ventricosus]
MTSRIDAPAKCELRSVIRFYPPEGNNAAEIHRRMSRVYGKNFISDGVVREWCKKFKDGRTDFMMSRDKDASLSQQKIFSTSSRQLLTCLITRLISTT